MSRVLWVPLFFAGISASLSFAAKAKNTVASQASPIHAQTAPVDERELPDARYNFINAINDVGQTTLGQCKGAKSYGSHSTGEMKDGYFFGMLVNFAKNVCATKDTKNSTDPSFNSVLHTSPDVANRLKDTLSWYKEPNYKDKERQLDNSASPLAQNYSLLLPLGMLESGGMFNEGRDKAGSNYKHDTAEAGLFQVSYNTVGHQVPKTVYDELMTKYNYGKNRDLCMVDLYRTKQPLSNNSDNWGNGPGVEFQQAMKDCPALATDYMAYLLRKDYNHNGPLLNHIARPQKACADVLSAVEKYAGNAANCASINNGSLEKALAQNSGRDLPKIKTIATDGGGPLPDGASRSRVRELLRTQAAVADAEDDSVGAQEARDEAAKFDKDPEVLAAQSIEAEKRMKNAKDALNEFKGTEEDLVKKLDEAKGRLADAKAAGQPPEKIKELEQAVSAANNELVLAKARKKALEAELQESVHRLETQLSNLQLELDKLIASKAPEKDISAKKEAIKKVTEAVEAAKAAAPQKPEDDG